MCKDYLFYNHNRHTRSLIQKANTHEHSGSHEECHAADGPSDNVAKVIWWIYNLLLHVGTADIVVLPLNFTDSINLSIVMCHRVALGPTHSHNCVLVEAALRGHSNLCSYMYALERIEIPAFWKSQPRKYSADAYILHCNEWGELVRNRLYLHHLEIDYQFCN